MTLRMRLRRGLSGLKRGSCVVMHLLILGCSAMALAAQKAPSTSASPDRKTSSGITTQVQREKEHGPPSEE